MSPSRPLAAGDPDPLDLDAAEQLERNEAGRLNLVRARAEKWIAGISALGGLLATVLVVKGRDSITDITPLWRVVVAGGLALALVVAAYATYRAYQAAFGTPGALAEINPLPLAGLHGRLAAARRATAIAALGNLKAAVVAIFVAIALIAAAVGVTWFAPTRGTPNDSTCVYSQGHLVAQLAGPSIAVRKSAPGATIGSWR